MRLEPFSCGFEPNGPDARLKLPGNGTSHILDVVHYGGRVSGHMGGDVEELLLYYSPA